jgi:hypothetical protein
LETALMALPELVTPVAAYVGTPALAYVAARSLRHFACALVVMVASFVAIKTDNDERRKACLALVDKVTRSSGRPPWTRRRAITRR